MRPTAACPSFPCAKCEVRDKAICAALQNDELRQLYAISTAVDVSAGQAIFFEGDRDRFLFNVVTGAVRLSKNLPDGRRQITGFLFPGDLLGLTIAGRYAYTAEAIIDSSFCRFDRGKLTESAERFRNLEHQLFNLASNELVQAQEHLLVLGRKSATERVATFLTRVAERIGERVGVGSVTELPMKREDIGDYVGLSLETVSRAISELRVKGMIVTPSSRRIEIPNTDALVQLSGDL